jgi:DNA-binding SARP family transcriptional activator/predicted ATPase
MADQLRLTLLGGLQVTLGGSRVTDFTSKKAPALLSYLAVTGRPHTREALSGLLWGESSEDRARASLRTVLWDLRQRMAPFLVIDRQRAGFKADSSHWVDVVVFSQHIETAIPDVASGKAPPSEGALLTLEQVEALQAAVSLYRGNLLAGFYVSDAPAFEEWVLKKREWARHLAIQALHRLIGHHLAGGTYSTGIDTATRLLEIAPWKEEAHRQLMTLLALSGQRSAALAQYETCRRMLAEELGVEPTAETQLIHERIRSGELLQAEGRESPLQAPLDRSTRRGDLPSRATSFVGRDQELHRLTSQLRDPERRLVTLVGADGVGKTRLALAAAERLAEDFEHGVYFVPLTREKSDNGPEMSRCTTTLWEEEASPSAERAALAMAIARALGTTFSGSAPVPRLVQLLDYVRHRTMLLVLDQVEPSSAERHAIAELCNRALYLTLLVTSSAPLNLEGEQVLDLAGLPVPPSSTASACEDLLAYDSVALFVERARGADEAFQLGADDRRDAIRISRALGGTPLSIELAAAWTGERSLSALTRDMQRSVNRIATGEPGLSTGERSVRAAFAYAWRQLSPTTGRSLAELTVFEEDFDGEAATAVTGVTPGGLDRLVERSLLSRSGAGRYAWHPSLRRLARERLEDASGTARDGEGSARPAMLRQRHAAHYLDFVAQREAALCGEQPQIAAAEIRREWGNVRRAWCWAVRQAAVDALALALRGLSHYLLLRGPLWEGEELFGMGARALKEAPQTWEDPTGAALVAELLTEEARFVNDQARYGQARRTAEEALQPIQSWRGTNGSAEAWSALEAAAHRERGKALWSLGDYASAREDLQRACSQHANERVMASSRRHLGLIALEEERSGEAQDALERALKLYRDLGDRRGEANLLNDLGTLALEQRRYAAARSQLEEALRLHQALGDQRGESAVRNNLARLADAQADYGLADAHGQWAVRSARDIGDQQAEAKALTTVGLLFLHEGKNEAAWTRSLQAVELARALGNRSAEARALTVLGHVFVALEMPDQATLAYEEALDLQRQLGQSSRATESLAGLARVSLMRDDVPQAQSYVDRICSALEDGDMIGTVEPLQVYLTCYQVLRTSGDPRADDILRRASGIFDGASRASGA